MRKKVLLNKKTAAPASSKPKTREDKKAKSRVAAQPPTKRSEASFKAKETVTMQAWFGLHNLKCPAGAHKQKKLLGRGPGSGHGKTSTRGSKGQTSRSGRDFYLGFEGGQMPLIRKVPKRGFTGIFKKEYQIVNLKDLGRIKETTISPETLEKQGLIKDKNKLVKILGEGEVKTPLTIQTHAISRKAADKVKNSGGTVEIINA